ncbi:hypothetical protein N7532_002887 [Penicillium argentinense]|uniref:Uncharacterized protein n=1 Tax=Penicillium argentinense TaxID=1131581 RepID=A0A9W9G2T5_9EURO|nr:uncharacterized protein N7532_002887 [Penicillium argentinense]KAJ5110242.1 hypothetical protein N7532_002887 [Penicillium argentinense]
MTSGVDDIVSVGAQTSSWKRDVYFAPVATCVTLPSPTLPITTAFHWPRLPAQGTRRVPPRTLDGRLPPVNQDNLNIVGRRDHVRAVSHASKWTHRTWQLHRLRSKTAFASWRNPNLPNLAYEATPKKEIGPTG